MDEIREALERMKADAALLAGADFVNMDDLAVVAFVKTLEGIGRHIDTARILSAAEVTERSDWELGSAGLSMQFDYRHPRDFLQHITGTSRAEASKRMRLGEQTRMRPSMHGELLEPLLPNLAEAMRAGEVGVDAANTIVTTLKVSEHGSAATPENMAAAEAQMVDFAKRLDHDGVAICARQWRLGLDPDGIEPNYERIRERRDLIVGREHNGISPITINAAPPVRAMITALFEDPSSGANGPRFMSEEDRERGTEISVDEDGQLRTKINDLRTLGQKQYDIFEGVLGLAVRAMQDGTVPTGTVAQVIATISLSELLAGKANGKLAGIEEIIPAKVIDQLVCDNGVYPIITDDTGFPLYHGTVKRFFTAAQRRAMIARDGDECVGLGCHRKATLAQAHHVTFVSEGGKTDIDEGVLMCPACHHALHSDKFELKMVDGHPWIRAASDYWDESAWRPAAKSQRLVGLVS